MLVYSLGVIGTETGEYGKNVEFDTVLLKKLRRFRYLVVGVLSVGIDTEFISVIVTVKTESYKKFILTEKPCPYVFPAR